MVQLARKFNKRFKGLAEIKPEPETYATGDRGSKGHFYMVFLKALDMESEEFIWLDDRENMGETLARQMRKLARRLNRDAVKVERSAT